MVVSFQSIEKTPAANATDANSIYTADKANLERLELITLLQSTLDLKTLLRHFLENLRKELPIDGIFFHEEKRNVKIKLGRQSTHSCGYRLTNDADQCGELIFKRNVRFNEKDLQTIENAVLLLLIPIGNSLKYMDAVNQAIQSPVRQVMERKKLHNALNREIELAKRHNHPLSLISITANNNSEGAEQLENFALSLHQQKNATDLIYRAASRHFIIVTPSSSEAITGTIDSIRILNDQRDNSGSMISLDLKIGFATLTGTDSVKSVLDRARRQQN